MIGLVQMGELFREFCVFIGSILGIAMMWIYFSSFLIDTPKARARITRIENCVTDLRSRITSEDEARQICNAIYPDRRTWWKYLFVPE